MPAVTLDPQEADLGDFADLIPQPERPPGTPELIGGDEENRAFQRLEPGGAVTEVPRALPTAKGVDRMEESVTQNFDSYFEDLIPPERRLEKVAFTERDELGAFADLIEGPAPDTASATVLAQTPKFNPRGEEIRAEPSLFHALSFLLHPKLSGQGVSELRDKLSFHFTKIPTELEQMKMEREAKGGTPQWHPEITKEDIKAGTPAGVMQRWAKMGIGEVSDLVHGLITPENMALSFGMAGIGKAAGGAIINRLIAGGFAADTAKAAVESGIEASELPPGPEREKAVIRGVTQLGLSALLGKHATTKAPPHPSVAESRFRLAGEEKPPKPREPRGRGIKMEEMSDIGLDSEIAGLKPIIEKATAEADPLASEWQKLLDERLAEKERRGQVPPTTEPPTTEPTTAVEPGDPTALKPVEEVVTTEPTTTAPDYDPENLGAKAFIERRISEGATREQAVAEQSEHIRAAEAWADELPTGTVISRKGDGRLYTKDSDGTWYNEDGTVFSGAPRGAKVVSRPEPKPTTEPTTVEPKPETEPTTAEETPTEPPLTRADLKAEFGIEHSQDLKKMQDASPPDHPSHQWRAVFNSPVGEIVGEKGEFHGDQLKKAFEKGGPERIEEIRKAFEDDSTHVFRKVPPEKPAVEPGPTVEPEDIAKTETPTETEVDRNAPRQVPLDKITLSPDVPQFKRGADAKGVVEPLEGTYDERDVGPIQLWERLDGRLELISGRHRFELAQRTKGKTSIWSQIHREADGFSVRDAARLDAELNIRDSQGSVADYANYFRSAEISRPEAESKGLLGRAKGKAGYEIGRSGSDDLFALHQSGKISDAQATAIAKAAPGDAELQRGGIRAALEGRSADYSANIIKVAQARKAAGGAAEGQADLFGGDDAAMRQMDEQAKRVSDIQRNLREQIAAVAGAAKRPAVAAKLGVDVKDPAGVAKRIAELKEELARWENWPMHKDLAAQIIGAPKPTTTAPTVEPAKPEPAAPTVDLAALDRQIANLEYRIAQDKRRSIKNPEDAARLAELKAQRAQAEPPKAEETPAGLRIEEQPETRSPNNKKIEGATFVLKDEAGKEAGIIEAEKLPNGDHQVFHVTVFRPHDGKGWGVKLYEALLNKVGKIVSDTVVSPAAARVYDSLEKKGWKVTRNPNVEEGQLDPGKPKALISKDGNPVFTVEKSTTGGLSDVTAPKLQKGQRQGDLTGGQEDLTLTGETGRDVAAEKAAADAAAKQAEADRAASDAQQGRLFEEPPVMEPPKPAVELRPPEKPAVPPPEEPPLSEEALQSGGPGGASAAEKLASYEQRKFGQRFIRTEAIDPAIREETGNLYYEPISNTLTKAEAREIIAERGTDEAVQIVRDESYPMAPRVRAMLGMELIDDLNRSQKEARAAGDTKAADQFSTQAIETAEYLMEFGTTLGQGVQVFAAWTKLMAADRVKAVKRMIQKGRAEHQAQFGGEIGQVIKGIKDAERLRLKDRKTGGDAAERKQRRKDERDEQDLIQREADRIAKHLSDTPFWKQLKGRRLNAISLIRAHLKEIQPNFIQRLVDEFSADPKLAESIDRMATENRKRIEGVRQTREIQRGEERFDAMTDRIARHLSDVPDFGTGKGKIDPARQLIKEHLKKEQPDFVERMRRMGVPEQKALLMDKLAKENRRRILAIDRSAKIEALKKQYTENRIGKKLQRADWERLVELNENGLLNDKTFYEAVAERFGLPKFDPEVSKNITRLNDAIEKAPEGAQKNEAAQNFLNYLADMKGMKPTDLGVAIWYANILSGYTTQFKNTVDTALNVFADSAVSAASHPTDIPSILSGLYRGMIRGGFEAVHVLKTGRAPIREKLQQQSVLERTRFGQRGGVAIKTDTLRGRFLKAAYESKAAKPLSLWKYPLRAMVATDTVFYHSFKEAKSRIMARAIAKNEGLRGKALFKRVDELLNNSDAQRQAAIKQAEGEGLKGLNFKRRVSEILEQGRPEDLVSNAHEAAQIATYNHKPSGTLGLVADKVAGITAGFPPGKFVVPFTEIVANVFNRLLNYTPWGYKRLFFGQSGGKGFATEAPMGEAARQALIKATLGTTAMATVAALDAAGTIQLTATGPQDIDAKRQLQNAGWKPYSIKIGGVYYSYQYSPLALGFAMVGHYKDAVRYNKLDEKDAQTRLAYGMLKGASTIFDMSFLSGVSDFFETVRGATSSVKGAERMFARTATSLVIPNLLKQFDKLWDPTLYDSNSVTEGLIRETPIARSLALKPMLNVLGDEIRPSQNAFFSFETDDPVWKFVVEKQAFIPVPSKTTKIGDEPINPEQYYRLIQESGPLIRQYITDNMDSLRAMEGGDAQDAVRKESERIRKDIKAQMRYE